MVGRLGPWGFSLSRPSCTDALTYLLLLSPEVSPLAESGEFQGNRWPAGLGREGPRPQTAAPTPPVATGEAGLCLLLPDGELSSLLFLFASAASLHFPKPPGPAVVWSWPQPFPPQNPMTLQVIPAWPHQELLRVYTQPEISSSPTAQSRPSPITALHIKCLRQPAGQREQISLAYS